MTLLDAPLRQPALYNPHLLSREELSMLFVARQNLLESLLEELRGSCGSESLQHHLILGQRGMGKTMLLRRLQIAIEEDPPLASRWIPLTFPEEQYNVGDLSDFWLNCLDALVDLLEHQGKSKRVQELDQELGSLVHLDPTTKSRGALEILEGFCRKEATRLVLLVDNIDLIFDRIRDEQWALREVLSSNRNLLMIGASSRVIESTFRYDQAFYDFFRIHELAGLDFPETQQFLLAYSDRLGSPQVRERIEADPGRLRSLHTLTGGNPRTLTLLFRILQQGIDGDVRTDLEQLLDQCTPLYKARFEELSPQAQQIVHGLAVHWDPTSAGELAEQLKMDVNAVSSQLNRLSKAGVVQKVPYDPPTKTGFQIAERFFNIWYLMRAGGRERERLLGLMKFLKLLYESGDLRKRASRNEHLKDSSRLIKNDRYEARQILVLPEIGAQGDHLLVDIWKELYSSCSSLIRNGNHSLLQDLARAPTMGERWRPLKEALEVVLRKDRGYLKRLAPEVRKPTEKILASFPKFEVDSSRKS